MSAPADHQTTCVLDRLELVERALHALLGREHVVELVLGDAVAEQRPLEVLLGPLLEAALAGEVLDVEDGADAVGLLAVPRGHVGAVGEGRREDDLRDVALVDQAVAEVLGRGRAVVAGLERGVGVDLRRQALVAEPLAVRAFDVDEVPGDVAGLVLGAQLGDRVARALVPDHVDAGLRHVGLDIGLQLRGLVGAAPGDDRHAVGAVLARRQFLRRCGCREGEAEARRRAGQQGVKSHSHRFSQCLPCLFSGCRRHGPRLRADLFQPSSARQSSAAQPTGTVSPTLRLSRRASFGTLTMKSGLPCTSSRQRM